MQHINKWHEKLRSTLKGQLEHKLFLMWAMSDSDDDADKLMRRLIDVRYERKAREAVLKHKEQQRARLEEEQYDQMEHDWDTKYNRVAFARSHMQKAIHHLSRIDHPLIAELEVLKAKLY